MAVVAAYLMKTEGLGWEQACAAVRAARPEAEWVSGSCPLPLPSRSLRAHSFRSSRPCRRVNLGFQEQLKLYETMGCAVDRSSALYKQYRLQMLTQRYPGERRGAWSRSGCSA